MSMGDYPYPSSYFTGNPDILLPAYPVRLMCEKMLENEDIVVALANAAEVYYNAS